MWVVEEVSERCRGGDEPTAAAVSHTQSPAPFSSTETKQSYLTSKFIYNGTKWLQNGNNMRFLSHKIMKVMSTVVQ